MTMEDSTPKAFISYSWDDETHRAWIRAFGTRLRHDGVDITLDQWHALPGDQLTTFMERSVRENDFVLVICTPRYKEKSNNRIGGVGYEGDIMTAEVMTAQNHRKFIPILRRSEWQAAAPSWLVGKYYIDLRGDPYLESNYVDLLSTLLGRRESAPPIGQRTIETSKKAKGYSQSSSVSSSVTNRGTSQADFELMIEAANELTLIIDRDRELKEIAKFALDHNEPEHAAAAANKLSLTIDRDSLYERILEHCFSHNKLAIARMVAKKLSLQIDRDRAMKRLLESSRRSRT